MKQTVLILLTLFSISACKDHKDHQPTKLNIMSFNIWLGGHSGPLNLTADVIQTASADVVGIQESFLDQQNSAIEIANQLKWYAYYKAESTASIISKYPIVDTSSMGNGVKIQISPNQFIWMFNIHLMYCPYEPYQLNGMEYCEAPLLETAEQAIESAWNTRGEMVNQVIKEINEAKKDNCPIFLTGDFNEPSYLDWTEKAVQAKACIKAVQWPCTYQLNKQAGLIDSYRQIYPDECTHRGLSWTSIPPKEGQKEIMDRIDFVMYFGSQLKLQKVDIVGEESDLSTIQIKNYPSDHRAIISQFEIN